MFKTFWVAVSVGSMIAATPAVADEGTVSTIDIEYKDLDLGTAKGQRILEQRIKRAAREICGIDEQRTGSRTTSSNQRRCMKSTMESARTQLAKLIKEEQLGG